MMIDKSWHKFVSAKDTDKDHIQQMLIGIEGKHNLVQPPS